MTEITFTHETPDGSEKYIRTGECCRCGECCMTGDPFEVEMGEPAIPGACPLLRSEGDGKFMCSDRQNPYYLSGCNVWPTHPGQISDKPSCSYRFEKVN